MASAEAFANAFTYNLPNRAPHLNGLYGVEVRTHLRAKYTKRLAGERAIQNL